MNKTGWPSVLPNGGKKQGQSTWIHHKQYHKKGVKHNNLLVRFLPQCHSTCIIVILFLVIKSKPKPNTTGKFVIVPTTNKIVRSENKFYKIEVKNWHNKWQAKHRLTAVANLSIEQ